MNLLLSLPKRFEMLFLLFSGCNTDRRLQNNRYGKMVCVVGVDGGKGLALRFESVSYTHLDVYKRQS